MPYQGSSQAVETNNQTSNQVGFNVRRDDPPRQKGTSFYNDDDSSTINGDSTIAHYKSVEELHSSTTSSIKMKATVFLHSLNGRPANANNSSHEATKIDYLLFRR